MEPKEQVKQQAYWEALPDTILLEKILAALDGASVGAFRATCKAFAKLGSGLIRSLDITDDSPALAGHLLTSLTRHHSRLRSISLNDVVPEALSTWSAVCAYMPNVNMPELQSLEVHQSSGALWTGAEQAQQLLRQLPQLRELRLSTCEPLLASSLPARFGALLAQACPSLECLELHVPESMHAATAHNLPQLLDGLPGLRTSLTRLALGKSSELAAASPPGSISRGADTFLAVNRLLKMVCQLTGLTSLQLGAPCTWQPLDALQALSRLTKLEVYGLGGASGSAVEQSLGKLTTVCELCAERLTTSLWQHGLARLPALHTVDAPLLDFSSDGELAPLPALVNLYANDAVTPRVAGAMLRALPAVKSFLVLVKVQGAPGAGALGELSLALLAIDTLLEERGCDGTLALDEQEMKPWGLDDIWAMGTPLGARLCNHLQLRSFRLPPLVLKMVVQRLMPPMVWSVLLVNCALNGGGLHHLAEAPNLDNIMICRCVGLSAADVHVLGTRLAVRVRQQNAVVAAGGKPPASVGIKVYRCPEFGDEEAGLLVELSQVYSQEVKVEVTPYGAEEGQ